MLILSQDGSIAVRFSDDCAVYCTKYESKTSVNITKHDSSFSIGVYSTEERAIKAVGRIADWHAVHGTYTLGNDGIIFHGRGLIFRMPADEEVNDDDKAD